ncbi:MAG: hypothetical protein ACYSX1_02300 [Planctomycetota bacterium]|jgi:hypothetical protein
MCWKLLIAISLLSLLLTVSAAEAIDEFIVIDDFEQYNNDCNAVWDTWEDGGWNATGSMVVLGTAPSAPVHGGTQSMLYLYDNTGIYFLEYYSEISAPTGGGTEELRIGPDWTDAGAKVLTMFFYGDPNNDANETEQMYVGVEDSAGLYAEVRYGDYLEGEDMNDIKEEQWHRWDIALLHFSDSYYASVPNDVNLQAIAKLYIGFGNRRNPLPGGDGIVYFDDIRLYPPICKPGYSHPGDLTGDCVVDFRDQAVLASQWWGPPRDPPADFAPAPLDGFVDWRDLQVLTVDWLDEMMLWP